jgi:hypothetical protein
MTEDSLENILKIAEQNNTERLRSDPEWTEKNHFHIHTIINAFSVGILNSHQFYWGYELPPNFAKVMNYMSNALQNEFKNEVVPQVNLIKMRGVYKRLAFQSPEYLDWNNIGNPGEGVYAISRFSSIPSEMSFIDLAVPPHNAVLYLRGETRATKKFDEDFKRRYPNDLS